MPDDTVASLPSWIWELDVTNDPSSATETWTDITPYVRGATVRRGRQVETGRDQAGTCSLELHNGDGRFDFFNAALENLVKNPSVETNTTGYAAINSSIARSNAAGAAQFGTFGINVTTQNIGDSGTNYGGVGVLPATAGVAYAFSAYARMRVPLTKAFEMLIVWLDSGGSLIDFEQLLFTLQSTSYTRWEVGGLAPAGTVAARVAIQTKEADGVYEFTTDGWLFEAVSAPIVNLLNNPSIEVNTTGYAADAASLNRNNGPPAHLGTYGLQVTTTNVIYSGVRTTQTLMVTAGLDYTFSSYVRLADASSKAMGLWITWYDAGNNQLSSSYEPFTLTSTTYARFSVTGTAPASADHVILYVITDAAVGVFEFDVDALQFEQASAPTTYVDGSLPTGYWDGADHASPSHLVTPSAYFDGSLPGGRWSGTAHASTSLFGSPYYPNFKPMRRVRGRATWASTTHPLYYGYLDDPVQEYPDFEDAISRVTATDAFKILAKKLVSGNFPIQRADVRIGAMLNAVGFPAAKRDLAVAVSTMDAIILEGVSALQHIQEVAESESGRFFISAAGDATFIDRHAAYLTTSQATFGEQEINYVDVQFGGGESLIYNEVKVTRAADGASTQEHADSASQAEFMPRTLEYSGQHMNSDNEASAKSVHGLALYKDYHPRIVRMDLQGVYQPDLVWPQALGRELGDRLTVRKRPPNAQMIEQESFIEWVEHRVGVGTWDVAIGLTSIGIDFQLYAAGEGFFILGDAVYGVLTTGPGRLVY